MGRALKKCSILGNIVIFKIDALSNQEKCLAVHFLRSVSIFFNKGLKLALKREFVSDVSLIPRYLRVLCSHLYGRFSCVKCSWSVGKVRLRASDLLRLILKFER